MPLYTLWINYSSANSEVPPIHFWIGSKVVQRVVKISLEGVSYENRACVVVAWKFGLRKIAGQIYGILVESVS